MITSRIEKTLALALVLAVGLIASGCSSGSNNNNNNNNNTTASQNQSAEGIWSGTLTSNTFGTLNVSGLVAGNGQAFFAAPLSGQAFSAQEEVLYSGQITVSGSTVSGSLTAYSFSTGTVFLNGTFVEEISVSGTVSSQDSFAGTYEGGDSGTFSLAYQPNSSNPTASLSLLTGSWAGISPQYITPGAGEAVFLFGSNGQISALEPSTGCTFAGQISVINSSLNAYSVTFSVSSCIDASLDTSYTGLAYLSAATTPNTFICGVTSSAPNASYTFVFTKEER
jgi:hypothetical protein